MKKRTLVKATMIPATFIVFVMVTSCGYNQKSENTKDIAEEQNEARFDNNDQEDDAEFLVNVAEINMEEIQLGKLAQQKGTTKEVKELGKMMEEAHIKLQSDLTALAKTKRISIPYSPTQKAQDAYKDLNEESGEDFDKEYANMMVNGHKDAIESFEKASTDSHDKDIRNWATTVLPDLRKHLDHSIDCQKKSADMHLEKK